MSFDIEQVCSFLRAQKEQVVKKSNDQSMLPIVVVERDESPVAIIISPNMNKDLATKAAIISKIGFDPNSLTVGFDATIRLEGKDQTKKDCIICHQITKDKKVEMAIMPYNFINEEIHWEKEIRSYVEIGGDMPEKLKEIMSKDTAKCHIFEDESVAEEAKKMSPEKFIFHSGRAALKVLIASGYKVIDLFSYHHPEWTDAKERGLALIKELVENNMIDQKHQAKLEEVVQNHIGTPIFNEKFEHYIHIYKCKLPKGIKLFKFVDMFQQMCMQPIPLKLNNLVKNN